MTETGKPGWMSSNVKIGPPELTRFERARVVGARALQIALGAPLLISPPVGITSSIELAIIELESNVLPITIRRTLPDGFYQNIPIRWLLGEEEPERRKKIKEIKKTKKIKEIKKTRR